MIQRVKRFTLMFRMEEREEDYKEKSSGGKKVEF